MIDMRMVVIRPRVFPVSISIVIFCTPTPGYVCACGELVAIFFYFFIFYTFSFVWLDGMGG